MFGVRKEKPNGGSIIIRRSLIVGVHVNKQAVLLAAAARTAEVTGLKRGLEQAEGELRLMKRQLEENKGKRFPALMYLRIDKIGWPNAKAS